MQQYKGKIIVHTGSMFSGKTSSLLEDLRRFEIAGYKVVLFKPTLDKRYAIDKVSTHKKDGSSIQRKAIRIESIEEIFHFNVYEYDVIGFDEFQFLKSSELSSELPNEVRVKDIIQYLVNICEKTVIIAGLDIDYLGNAFNNVKEILPIADYVYKHHAVCIGCGNDAWISHRTTNEKEQIKIGGAESYIPLCRKCYLKIKGE